MPRTPTQTCVLCGLRYTNSALLELHIREDHVQRNRQAAPGRGDSADRKRSQGDAGASGRSTVASRPPSPVQEQQQ